MPVVAGTNNVGKGFDGPFFSHYGRGLLNESISKNPMIRLQYYLNQKVYQQEFNEGRSHIVNEGEELEEIQNTYNMLPIVKASAFPMFANQYLIDSNQYKFVYGSENWDTDGEEEEATLLKNYRDEKNYGELLKELGYFLKRYNGFSKVDKWSTQE